MFITDRTSAHICDENASRAPAFKGSSMAVASEYQSRQKQCEVNAQHSCSEEARLGWLCVAESYAILLDLDGQENTALIGPTARERDLS